VANVSEESVVTFIKKLDGINSELDAFANGHVDKAFIAKWRKLTDKQSQSINDVISFTKKTIIEVEALKTPSSCKLLKEIFLQKCRVRIDSLGELLSDSLQPNEVLKILEKEEKKTAEISGRYKEERRAVMKEYEAKF
jgi:hypothetical protein